MVHLFATLHISTMDVRVVGGQRDGTGNQFHISALAGTLLSKGESHFATAVVAYKADWVNLLIGRTSGDHDLLPSEWGIS